MVQPNSKQAYANQKTTMWILLFAFLIGVVTLWVQSRHVKLDWENVPPAPTIKNVTFLSLGDEQMAYRSLGFMLQSFGNTSGRYLELTKYDYNRLAQWFDVLDELDPRSEFLPYLVSYYYAASHNPEHVRVAVNLLEKVGVRVGGQKWRWLSQAVYLARYKLKNYDYSMALAEKLSNHADPKVNGWARNMQAIILEGAGEKEMALQMSLGLLKDHGRELHPKEVFYLTEYICNDLLEADQKAKMAMCASSK